MAGNCATRKMHANYVWNLYVNLELNSIKSHSHFSLISVNCPAFYLIPDAALRVWASGSSKKTGLVVDFGSDVISVVAVFEGNTSFFLFKAWIDPPAKKNQATRFLIQSASCPLAETRSHISSFHSWTKKERISCMENATGLKTSRYGNHPLSILLKMENHL